jgi:hypothetical protein
MARWGLAVVALLALSGCSGGHARELARYYDPNGLFTTDLPATNDVTVTSPQPAAGGPGVLGGVISAPPQPSPSPSDAFGTGLGGQPVQSDRTVYEALVVTTDSFRDLPAMVVYFLTGNPGIDVQTERAAQVGGAPGRLVVADIHRGGQTTASIAAAFSLGDGRTGYIVAAIFPPGTWSAEEPDFLRVLRSFRPGVPPAIRAVPLVPQAA